MNSCNSNLDQTVEVAVTGDLRDLTRRLRPGMIVEGRIVDVLTEQLYILRIWGYNMVMDSQHLFDRGNEINLAIKAVEPKLVLECLPGTRELSQNSGHRITNILV